MMSNRKWYKYKKSNTDTSKCSQEDKIIIRKYLIIVESPSKCKKIEEYLGEDYTCIASKGHLRDIQGLKSINTKGNFEIEFSIIKEKESNIEFMKKHIEKYDCSHIYLATDDDREGEAIAWHICEIFKLPIETTKRITFNEITKSAILQSIQNPKVVNMNLVNAQHARQVLDVIVGYKISPFLWKHLYSDKNKSLSAGRCQTPALRLIYENQKEMDCSPDVEIKYKTTASFFSNNTIFTLNHEMESEKEVVEFLEKSKPCHKFRYILHISDSVDCKCSPPKPLNTSGLLQKASNTLHISPKQTMQYCQQLYQDGHITYMRTDNTKFSKEFLEKIKNYIENNYSSKYIGNTSNIVNNDNLNPHEAIRPTHIENKFIKYEDSRISSLYQFIWKTTMESCMSDYTYKAIHLTIPAPNNLEYRNTLEIPVFLGFKKMSTKEYTMTSSQSQETGNLLFYQSITKKNDNIGFMYNEIQSKIKVNFKHNHYTEASLINKLETMGIGRPSTFSSIVETIQERGYVKRCDTEGKTILCKDYHLQSDVLSYSLEEKVFGREKNKLIIQNIGILTLEFLMKYFSDIFAYEYTSKMESALDVLAQPSNTLLWYNLCKVCYNEIKSLSKPISKLEKQLFKINEEYDVAFISGKHVLRKMCEDGSIEFKSIKPDLKIDLEKLKNGEYTIDDLLEIKKDCLGKYKDHNVYLKSGKYGNYIQCGDNRVSIKTITKDLNTLTLEDVIGHIYSHEGMDVNNPNDTEKDGLPDNIRHPAPPPISSNILRTIDDSLSIRKGKFGPYIFYKTQFMKTPTFFNLTPKYKKTYESCSLDELKNFIREKYNIAMN